jgi:RNA polymerase sigma factor (sigma-70 family)
MAELHRSESTATLLTLLKQGDSSARDRLFARYLPVLRRWAHGRLPSGARDLNDTDDLVQISLMSALKNLDQFESRHEGALLAYLRASILNAMRGELRRVGRTGLIEAKPVEQDPEAFADGTLNIAARLDTDQWIDYERALSKLAPSKREAVLLRLEFGMSYAEIAAALERPSEAAASMMVTRALLELAQHLQ